MKTLLVFLSLFVGISSHAALRKLDCNSKCKTSREPREYCLQTCANTNECYKLHKCPAGGGIGKLSASCQSCGW